MKHHKKMAHKKVASLQGHIPSPNVSEPAFSSKHSLQGGKHSATGKSNVAKAE